jgi:hypothetical protein
MAHPRPFHPTCRGRPGSTMTGTVRTPPVSASMRASASWSPSTSYSVKSIPRHSRSSLADAQNGHPGVVNSSVWFGTQSPPSLSSQPGAGRNDFRFTRPAVQISQPSDSMPWASEVAEAVHDERGPASLRRRMSGVQIPGNERSEPISLREARIVGELRRACEDSSVMTLQCDVSLRYSLCLLPQLALRAASIDTYHTLRNVQLYSKRARRQAISAHGASTRGRVPVLSHDFSLSR